MKHLIVVVAIAVGASCSASSVMADATQNRPDEVVAGLDEHRRVLGVDPRLPAR